MYLNTKRVERGPRGRSVSKRKKNTQACLVLSCLTLLRLAGVAFFLQIEEKPSTSKKIMIRFIAIFFVVVVWTQAHNITKVGL